MIELFLFSWGSQVRRYTSSSQPITWSGETWEPATIGRGRIKLEAKIEGSDVSIDMDVSGDVPGLFKRRAPRQTVGVTIYRGDESDLANSVQSIWMGEVAKVKFGPKIASMTCSPTISLGRGRLPIGRFSVGCRWQVYSPACGLDLQDWVESALIQGANPAQKRVIIDPIARYSAQNLVGGFYLDNDGERYLIIAATETSTYMDITFDEWPPGLESETAGRFAPGCDHSLARCKVFGNEYNYGGFPALPQRQ